MNDLLQAAKAVISWFHDEEPSDLPIEQLIFAVERAEKRGVVGFEEWWEQNGIEWEWTILEHDAKALWTAAQQAERERIRDIIKAVGVQGEHDQWFDACDKIMEAIDATIA